MSIGGRAIAFMPPKCMNSIMPIAYSHANHHALSREYDWLSGCLPKGKLLFSGYDPHSQKFQIHEFFIDSVLEHATLHARYISGAGWGTKSPK